MVEEASGDIKKALQLRYSFNWNQELSRLMGVFSFFYTNARHYRAFWNLNSAILHVDRDPLHRLFIVDPTKEPHVLDQETKTRFEELKAEFQSLYGSGKSKDDKFSYLDLKPRMKVDPYDLKVIIPRKVPFWQAWEGTSDRSLKEQIGFAWKEKEYVPFLGWVDKLKPMVDRNDHHADPYTNCIPYELWEDQTRKVVNLLLPVSKDIELIMAAYLQREGFEYSPSVNELSIDSDAQAKPDDGVEEGEREVKTEVDDLDPYD